jgi:DNA helicase II / ATP-dependent DNA helicase PcrA
LTSPRTAKGILDFLSAGISVTDNEEARKIYVGASRAQRLLAIAIPKSQASRLVSLLRVTEAPSHWWFCKYV